MEEDRVIICVDMNAFFAAVEQKSNPHLAGKPVIVCGNPETRTTVAAASYEAKACGVKSGMSLPEAKKLCPDAILVVGTPMKYVDTAEKIFEILKSYTPLLEIFSIDEAFLDITRTYHFWGKPLDVGRSIKERIKKEVGLTCSVGIGPNKLIAKLASNMQKPDGLVIITKEQIPVLLENLPVSELCGIGPKLTRHLANIGVITCGDLARIPVTLLTRKFGIIGQMLHNMARGISESSVVPYHVQPPVKSMGHCYTLPRNTYDKQWIKSTLLILSEKVGKRLRRDGYQGRTVSLFIRYGDFTGFSKQVTLKQHINSGIEIYKIASRIFDSIDFCGKSIRLVGVSVSNLMKGMKQLYFLEDYNKQRALLEMVDRINDKYGEFTVKRAATMYSEVVPKTHGFMEIG
jgi:DNA polymerase-4